MAAAGAVVACIPGVMIIGWVLLPISFILGIASLFMTGKTKWQGAVAVAVSIVGTGIAVLVFTTVLVTAVDDALDTEVSVSTQPTSNSTTDQTGDSGDPKAGTTRDNPVALGTEITSSEWKVVINSVTFAADEAVAAANTFNEPPTEGNEYILINYTVTYTGTDPNGQAPAFVIVEYVTPDGNTIDGLEVLAVAPDEFDSISTLYSGASVTGNKALMVPSATAQEGVLAVSPGLLADKVFVAVK